MKDIEVIKEIINNYRNVLEETYKVKKIALFGSYIRGEQNKESDVDILVEFKDPVGLLFIHLADFLEHILGLKVDLITPDAIKPNRREIIKKELIYV